MVTLSLTGIAQVTQHLQRLSTAPLPATGEALYEEGQRIMGQSVQLVPVDTGNLRSTSHVDRPVIAGSRAEVELSYGKFGDADYCGPDRVRCHAEPSAWRPRPLFESAIFPGNARICATHRHGFTARATLGKAQRRGGRERGTQPLCLGALLSHNSSGTPAAA